jgi:hypothetical protein
MTSGPSTAGTSQTPYMKACDGGNAVNAVDVVFQRFPHAQKTTPKATAMAEATTTSTVRQDFVDRSVSVTPVGPVVVVVMCSLLSGSDGAAVL